MGGLGEDLGGVRGWGPHGRGARAGGVVPRRRGRRRGVALELHLEASPQCPCECAAECESAAPPSTRPAAAPPLVRPRPPPAPQWTRPWQGGSLRLGAPLPVASLADSVPRASRSPGGESGIGGPPSVRIPLTAPKNRDASYPPLGQRAPRRTHREAELEVHRGRRRGGAPALHAGLLLEVLEAPGEEGRGHHVVPAKIQSTFAKYLRCFPRERTGARKHGR